MRVAVETHRRLLYYLVKKEMNSFLAALMREKQPLSVNNFLILQSSGF
jgi:hypothetical protein